MANPLAPMQGSWSWVQVGIGRSAPGDRSKTSGGLSAV